jgi:hypothetical protein
MKLNFWQIIGIVLIIAAAVFLAIKAHGSGGPATGGSSAATSKAATP